MKWVNMLRIIFASVVAKQTDPGSFHTIYLIFTQGGSTSAGLSDKNPLSIQLLALFISNLGGSTCSGISNT